MIKRRPIRFNPAFSDLARKFCMLGATRTLAMIESRRPFAISQALPQSTCPSGDFSSSLLKNLAQVV